SSRSRTNPITTRPRIERSKSSYERPASSSSGQKAILPYRHVRSSSYTQATQLEEFRSTRRWPPAGFNAQSVLNTTEAQDVIGAGASTFKGYWDQIPNAGPEDVRFFAVMDSEHNARSDRAICRHEAFAEISLTVTGPADNAFPWVSLEQPCMAYAFGRSPGTTTLNYRVSKFGTLKPLVQVGSKVKPRKIKLLLIMERLSQLEQGLEEDDPDKLYEYLYTYLISDPDEDTEPHYGMELQIIDLITVLSHSEWVDYSSRRNQVLAKFFNSPKSDVRHRFYHQLLLSCELYLRIHCSEHEEKAKRQILKSLPPKIAWDLAVAQRWLENISISKRLTSSNESEYSFNYVRKRVQKEALAIFAETLKWPNMAEIEDVLEEKDSKKKPLEGRSNDAMSWFTGVILPGPTLPWVLMNTLIDCDKDTGPLLKYLTHIYPSSGFQYRATTYWSYRCIVGKVLGASRGVNQVAGWIGPCNYTPDLKRTECVHIRQSSPPEYNITTTDIDTMGSRSHPLGPDALEYPAEDYELLIPDTEDVTDVIRVEKLSFQPSREQPETRMGPDGPMTFDAAVIFACGGESWPMRLRYDVDFIAAYPCHQGPHVLFYDYAYKAIKVDEGLVDIHDWGPHPRSHPSTPRSRSYSHPTSRHSPASSSLHSRSNSQALTTQAGPPSSTASSHIERVLAIEALGVSDNEVFARAWCAHWGLSAVVANIKDTCMACAIREAYAACVSVVILTEGGRKGEGDV
ncbi:hypothetical protein M501DRAFT_932306, partial [Patellaria atrata CBS 101060]